MLLNKNGQTTEATFIYNRAASLLDYEQGSLASYKAALLTQGQKQVLRVLLPALATERILPDQVRYTPERLQALADTAIAHEEMSFGSNKEALAHLQEATRLYPDSPVTNYYLGEELLGTDNAGAKTAYQKAIELGDDATITAAKERISACR